MASRKTYFGIGLPKDPTDPTSAADPADQSSPTVVDDEKVAEGLKTLRSWYQESSSEDDTRKVVAPPVAAQPAPAPVSVTPIARPTAVGHATGETPAQTQRPVAPDPMRATMFGHDIHRFDFDLPQGDAGAKPQPAVIELGGPDVNTAPPLPRSQPEPSAPRAEAPSWPAPPAAEQPDAFRFADYLRRQAAQPRAPAAAWVPSLDDTDVHAAPAVPIAARVVFGIGVAAICVAVVIWFQSRSNSETPVPVPPATAPAPGATYERPATAPAAAPERKTAAAPARLVDPVERASRAIEAGRAAAKPRGTDVAGSAPARTVRRAPAVKAEAPRGDEAPGESAATTAPAAEEAAPRTPPAPTEERAAAPEAPASEPARPQKAPKKTREKNPAGIDMDATLPPSLGD